MTSSTTWPEGAAVRYLTVGGATVQVGANDHSTSHTASCTGCRHTETLTGLHLDRDCTDEYVTGQTRLAATRWAQSHAETCRAMPKPNA